MVKCICQLYLRAFLYRHSFLLICFFLSLGGVEDDAGGFHQAVQSHQDHESNERMHDPNEPRCPSMFFTIIRWCGGGCRRISSGSTITSRPTELNEWTSAWMNECTWMTSNDHESNECWYPFSKVSLGECGGSKTCRRISSGSTITSRPTELNWMNECMNEWMTWMNEWTWSEWYECNDMNDMNECTHEWIQWMNTSWMNWTRYEWYEWMNEWISFEWMNECWFFFYMGRWCGIGWCRRMGHQANVSITPQPHSHLNSVMCYECMNEWIEWMTCIWIEWMNLGHCNLKWMNSIWMNECMNLNWDDLCHWYFFYIIRWCGAMMQEDYHSGSTDVHIETMIGRCYPGLCTSDSALLSSPSRDVLWVLHRHRTVWHSTEDMDCWGINSEVHTIILIETMIVFR